MLVKFFNGYVCDISISTESIDYKETCKDIYKYIIEHQEDTGISENDLIFLEQVDFFINDDKNDMIYAFINSIDTIDILIVFSWIEYIPLLERENKIKKYLQFLCDRHLLCLSIGRKYCELWFNKENDMPNKVSICWNERKLDKMEIDKFDDDKYICKNIPILISNTYYYPTLLFYKEDLD